MEIRFAGPPKPATVRCPICGAVYEGFYYTEELIPFECDCGGECVRAEDDDDQGD